jgi:hypothetical protein
MGETPVSRRCPTVQLWVDSMSLRRPGTKTLEKAMSWKWVVWPMFIDSLWSENADQVTDQASHLGVSEDKPEYLEGLTQYKDDRYDCLEAENSYASQQTRIVRWVQPCRAIWAQHLQVLRRRGIAPDVLGKWWVSESPKCPKTARRWDWGMVWKDVEKDFCMLEGHDVKMLKFSRTKLFCDKYHGFVRNPEP